MIRHEATSSGQEVRVGSPAATDDFVAWSSWSDRDDPTFEVFVC
jgi:hypothetical protein